MQVIAHRGAKGYASENTIAAFGKALELGADGIEIDVHVSADGHPIVFHDEHTQRLTGIAGAIKDLSLGRIGQLRVDRVHAIPTLEQTLDFIDARCLVNIELKMYEAAEPVMHCIEKYISGGKWDYGRFLVSSFDWTALQHIRSHNPQIQLGVLTETDLDLAIGFARSINAETLHPYFHLLDELQSAKIKEANMRIYAWTVNMPEDISRIKRLRVDGIITDYPDRP